MDKPLKSIKISEHIIHIVLTIFTDGVWLIVYLLRAVILQSQIMKLSPDEKAKWKQGIKEKSSKNVTTTKSMPKQVLEYKKRTFASTAEAEEDYYSDYADDYAYQVTGDPFTEIIYWQLFAKIMPFKKVN